MNPSISNVPIYINRGDCSTLFFEFFEEGGETPVDISGWEFKAQIKKLYDDAPAFVLAEFVFTNGDEVNQKYGDLTSVDTLKFPVAAATEAGEKNLVTLSYDVRVKIDGCWFTVQEGPIYVNPTVTRVTV